MKGEKRSKGQAWKKKKTGINKSKYISNYNFLKLYNVLLYVFLHIIHIRDF